MKRLMHTPQVASLIFSLLILVLFPSMPLAQQPNTDTAEVIAEQEVINAVLRTATIYVKDWDASLKFYSEYLGYEILVEQAIEKEKSLKTLGAKPGVTARIAYLKAVNSLIKRPFSGSYLGLISFSGENTEEYKRPTGSHTAMLGEVVLAHQVVGIDAIYKKVQKAGMQLVAELSLSGAGKSRSFSVIDPNGVRIELYEFIPGEEPINNP